MREAANGNPQKAEREMREELGQLPFRHLAARQRVGDDPDLVAACDLFAREILHVTEKTADGRPQHMQDAQRRVSFLCGMQHSNALLARLVRRT
jgi:hypothetical protein